MENYRQFLEEVILLAKRQGATYADTRLYVFNEKESIDMEDGRIVNISRSGDQGFGVRVLVDGAWGFYAIDELDRSRIPDVVRRAVSNARINSRTRKNPVRLLPLKENERNREYHHETKFEKDPFLVSLDEKANLLLAVYRAMKEASPKTFKGEGSLSASRFRKLLFTTDNIFADQTFTRVGFSITAVARRKEGDDDLQSRSWPSPHGSVLQKGWEAVEEFRLVENAGRIAHEAELFVHAPDVSSGRRDIILTPEQNNLHGTHETIHGAEGDRVVDKEWSLAGGSLFSGELKSIGKFRFGSSSVNIVADSVTPGGVGTFACDDEGIPARDRVWIVREGIWVGLLVSRESAPELNDRIGREYFTEASSAMRAMDHATLPLIRMNNITLLSGDMPYEEMLDRAPVGTVIFDVNKSWSIDPYRRDFQFGTEVAWEKVRRFGFAGRPVWRPVRNAVYRGDNLKEFWRKCVAVADEKSAMLLGVGNCGKGVPMQTMATGHKTSPAWFENIRVDSARAGRKYPFFRKLRSNAHSYLKARKRP